MSSPHHLIKRESLPPLVSAGRGLFLLRDPLEHPENTHQAVSDRVQAAIDAAREAVERTRELIERATAAIHGAEHAAAEADTTAMTMNDVRRRHPSAGELCNAG